VANALQPSAREAFLNGDIDWSNDDIRVVLVDVGYVYSSAHNMLDDVGAGFRVATSSALTGKTATNGIADANDVTFAGLTGDEVVQIYVYQHTGVESTSRLIVYYDTEASGALISGTPDGSDAILRWSNGTNRIFKL
jgi:hypothetical protein